MMKRIAVINDLSGFGRCSLTAALPVISALGIEACPLPTAILSNQTGYPSFFCTDYTENLYSYINEWKKLGVKFDGILTGYLTSAKQAEIIYDFVEEFADVNTLVFVDPVMADDGVLYDTYDSNLCKKVKKLTKRANIIAPNLTELCILCDADYEKVTRENSIQKTSEIAASLLTDTLKTVIVTGVKIGGEIHNIIVDKNGEAVVKSRLIGGSYSGTGDLFSSVVCAEAVKGKSILHAVNLATVFLQKSIEDSYKENTDRNYGVNFQQHLEMLIYE
ncbi:MAG: pyridoxamine kinase [Clostridia bacterium]|nr:pyridoxamine kinase [Clostridia bacterium]